MKRINSKGAKGITLIALVITIIVMLILVAVTISLAVNGGLFEYAGKAVSETQKTLDQEKTLGDVEEGLNTDALIAKYTGQEMPKPAYSESLLDSDGVLTKNAIWTDTNNKTVEIPKGFKVSSEPTEQTLAGGLVIQDKIGNEFVWIPVTVTGSTQAEKEASFDAIRTTKGNNSYIESVSGDETEYNAMRASVINNGGFYIARYEAGYTTGRTKSDSSVSVAPLSKKGAYPYNMVNWSDAVTSSRSMYTDKNKYGVTSTLCYGVQWDAMLVFLGKTSETDSTSWGNYYDAGPFDFTGEYYTSSNDQWKNDKTSKTKDTDMLLQTGMSGTRNQLKNIYDVAGNVSEWTMEAYASTLRVSRGGAYSQFGGGSPVSDRGGGAPAGIIYYGFRPTLYL